MQESIPLTALINLLAQAWQFHQSPAFIEYAWEMYGCSLATSGNCDAIYLAQAEEGNVDLGSIGGMVKQWWSVDYEGIIPIDFAKLPRFRDAPENVRSSFYLVPVIKFYVNGDKIVLNEAFGPNMRCCKVGTLNSYGGDVDVVNVRIIWSTKQS